MTHLQQLSGASVNEHDDVSTIGMNASEEVERRRGDGPVGRDYGVAMKAGNQQRRAGEPCEGVDRARLHETMAIGRMADSRDTKRARRSGRILTVGD